MLRSKLPFFVAVLVFAAAASGACDDGAEGPAVAANGGTGAGSTSDSVCPDVAPDAGETCLLPEGTTCALGACGSPIARCSDGVWRYGGNPPPLPPCPVDFPVAESACPACWPPGRSCIYGSVDCSDPGATANTTIASCADGRWTVRAFPCADAGADVQRDAEAEAD